MGFTLGIIDDPFKDREEANSEVIRKKVWEWYTSTFLTRAEKNARILLTMTRWHEDDLAGRLLQKAKEDPEADQWTVLNLPAIKDKSANSYDKREFGDPLWPGKYPLERLKQIRSSVGEMDWNALFQQTPSAMEGNLIKREWLKYHKGVLAHELDEVCVVADLTFKKTEFSDFACIEAWGRKGADVFLLEQIRARMNFPEQLDAIRSMSSKYPGCPKYIEEAANGAAVIQTLRGEIMGIIPINPRTAKEARLQAVAHVYEAGNVHYPDPNIFPWVEVNIEELVSFPNATNDDTVDTATMAISQLAGVGSSASRIEALSAL